MAVQTNSWLLGIGAEEDIQGRAEESGLKTLKEAKMAPNSLGLQWSK